MQVQEPLIRQLPETIADRGRVFEVFKQTGPMLEHRGFKQSVQLVIPCDLNKLDACLQRLPQDKTRQGFRLNVNVEPWMLRPNGNWAAARVSRSDGKRIGWKPTSWYVHADGLCAGSFGSGIRYYRLQGSSDLPHQILIGQALAQFCSKLNANPSGIHEYGLDSSSHCMCCGKTLSVRKSQVRGVGPECLSILNAFLGTDSTVAELELGV